MPKEVNKSPHSSEGWVVQSLDTAGLDDCGFHAALGAPNEQGQLEKQNVQVLRADLVKFLTQYDSIEKFPELLQPLVRASLNNKDYDHLFKGTGNKDLSNPEYHQFCAELLLAGKSLVNGRWLADSDFGLVSLFSKRTIALINPLTGRFFGMTYYFNEDLYKALQLFSPCKDWTVDLEPHAKSIPNVSVVNRDNFHWERVNDDSLDFTYIDLYNRFERQKAQPIDYDKKNISNFEKKIGFLKKIQERMTEFEPNKTLTSKEQEVFNKQYAEFEREIEKEIKTQEFLKESLTGVQKSSEFPSGNDDDEKILLSGIAFYEKDFTDKLKDLMTKREQGKSSSSEYQVRLYEINNKLQGMQKEITYLIDNSLKKLKEPVESQKKFTELLKKIETTRKENNSEIQKVSKAMTDATQKEVSHNQIKVPEHFENIKKDLNSIAGEKGYYVDFDSSFEKINLKFEEIKKKTNKLMEEDETPSFPTELAEINKELEELQKNVQRLDKKTKDNDLKKQLSYVLEGISVRLQANKNLIDIPFSTNTEQEKKPISVAPVEQKKTGDSKATSSNSENDQKESKKEKKDTKTKLSDNQLKVSEHFEKIKKDLNSIAGEKGYYVDPVDKNGNDASKQKSAQATDGVRISSEKPKAQCFAHPADKGESTVFSYDTSPKDNQDLAIDTIAVLVSKDKDKRVIINKDNHGLYQLLLTAKIPQKNIFVQRENGEEVSWDDSQNEKSSKTGALDLPPVDQRGPNNPESPPVISGFGKK
jgi:hypothetical protein